MFEIKGARNFEAIVYNYLFSTLCGFAFIFFANEGLDLQTIQNIDLDWLWVAIVEGCLFIGVFMAMALTSQKLSITSASVASKMSMVIPIAIFLVINPNDVPKPMKLLGIALAIIAVYLTTNRKDTSWDNKYWYLPVSIFLGSGIIDFLLGYAEQEYLHTPLEQQLFIPSIFGITFCIGLVFLLHQYFIKKMPFNMKSLIGGAALGIINFGSLYFFINALGSSTLVKSAVFSINNMGIIALSALIAMVFFKEKLSTMNFLGLFLGLVAILIILVSQ